MPEDLLTMSAKEVDRAGLIRRVLEGRLPQVKAAEMMGVTPRQVRRMCRAYESQGPRGLISGKRGKPSDRSEAKPTRLPGKTTDSAEKPAVSARWFCPQRLSRYGPGHTGNPDSPSWAEDGECT
jgi:hypothetical protein